MKNCKNLFLALTVLSLMKPISAGRDSSVSNDTVGNVMIGAAVLTAGVVAYYCGAKGYDYWQNRKQQNPTLETSIAAQASKDAELLRDFEPQCSVKIIYNPTDFSDTIQPLEAEQAAESVQENKVEEKVTVANQAKTDQLNGFLDGLFKKEQISTATKTINTMPELFEDNEASNY